MAILLRPKLKTIYDEAGGWWDNDEISYVAHAITNSGEAIRLADTNSAAGGAIPTKHPDQLYWKQTLNALPSKGVVRIEIDCTLLPCDGQYMGCLFQVPALIRKAGIPNTPLRIFGHRKETLPMPGQSSKRYFECHSGDTNPTLIKKFAAGGSWSWVEWKGKYE